MNHSSLSLLMDVLKDFKEIEDSIDRFNRAIDIIEWITYNGEIRKHVPDRNLEYMKYQVMSSSPDYCDNLLFEIQENLLAIELSKRRENIQQTVLAK
ncbi:lutB [Acrasis kona]|uniref:LutB n=1 Tax=Acrasis kona TaxID=1008807 RepID=A0AAW2Z5H4_9EUKA